MQFLNDKCIILEPWYWRISVPLCAYALRLLCKASIPLIYICDSRKVFLVRLKNSIIVSNARNVSSYKHEEKLSKWKKETQCHTWLWMISYWKGQLTDFLIDWMFLSCQSLRDVVTMRWHAMIMKLIERQDKSKESLILHFSIAYTSRT